MTLRRIGALDTQGAARRFLVVLVPRAERGVGLMLSIRSKIAACTAVVFFAVTGAALAVPSTTTGIDYVADLVDPVKGELTLAIVAGLGLMVVLIAVKAGTRLVKSFGR